MSFRTSVCPNTTLVRPPKFVPMLSTPLFSIRMICQTYLWIPYVQAEVLRPIWFKSILKFENSVCLAVYLSICLFVCKKLFVHLCLSVRLSVCLSENVRPPLFVYLFFCLLVRNCSSTPVLPEGRAKASVAGQFASLLNET